MYNLTSLVVTFLFLVVGSPLAAAFAPRWSSQDARHLSVPSETVLRMAVKDIGSEGAFDNEVKSAGDKLVVVDYSTTWCGPCKVIAPKFAEFSDKYASDAVFLSVVGDASADAR